MRKYCKAYHLKDLQAFAGWVSKKTEHEQTLTDDTICYIWDDFTVVESPITNKELLFDDVTPEWQHFCKATLNFAIPEDLQYAYQSSDEQVAEPAR
jgi:hypothetical protein